MDNSDIILDGQEINDVPCTEGTVFSYDILVAFSTDPNAMTMEEINEFEELFTAECNELSIRFCDPNNYFILSTEVLLNSRRRHRALWDEMDRDTARWVQESGAFVVPATVVAAQFNGATDMTPLFPDNDLRRQLQTALSSKYDGGGDDDAVAAPRIVHVSSGKKQAWNGSDGKSRALQTVGDTSDGPCRCEFTRAPEGVPILQEDVTTMDVNDELAQTPNSDTAMITTVVDGGEPCCTVNFGNCYNDAFCDENQAQCEQQCAGFFFSVDPDPTCTQRWEICASASECCDGLSCVRFFNSPSFVACGLDGIDGDIVPDEIPGFCCTINFRDCFLASNTFCNANQLDCESHCKGFWFPVEEGAACSARYEACSSSSDCCDGTTCLDVNPDPNLSFTSCGIDGIDNI